ncbi:UDP-N-acetylmuramoyl-tripeptide--D-alanyl-D-alanine ligase [Colwellia sp. 4_MG-2023]|jgi:UDP-N-acetylmuramoyl-tripeptide--D-alanyl-D-alanine ligase|uniref:UDP-N-acetylmuramoyl-tripeptide--D-alanyl-D- alanine ligase n=1 Tax=unclassified Colwellia TaxID=196834 RepID=UPI001C097F19|nr:MULTISPECIES: UDP-N-acetylmuramoyl-tripeptide--D-alanyl-D-alanine ligase [unclassified Colwellia]MBU2926203.1 UDP-N-acetylmuramoyl-tripeptide--D-alanyl-D-alanine ligase [Colwellia sp. C2M11]MDO6507173.1 UDP-N-acetylmuramoyl-tripeptide--D-alanyl-D-alanine ligase [Colwellia sp. 5_MG-2023]MDO6556009.1 UDP-N-acetylmuramoyl-tripeptide--D-alanyl-D-alanine ligase [Colwellia sp. 4_MG-2023]MDO6652376.1 UDP-N-acetylmuramoyl-tripeptide--D-alanyl-D-alanine ligase [Colwellia sp. 3_MG-2023]MDO6665749.1 U
MISIALSTFSTAINGDLICDDSMKMLEVNNVVTDSREFKLQQTAEKQSAFLALKGPNFDGHLFVQQVIDYGCQVLVVDHKIENIDSNKVAQIIVDDTRIALGKIGAYVKQQVAPKTIGITGSSGKTTVKEMIAAILSRLGNVLATNGNFNNDIGVPLTLLRLEDKHAFAVIEMGANHMGEIAYTTELVKPDVAMINNIAAAHLEGFGDLCGVARAKGEIFSGLPSNGVALYNHASKYTDKWQWRLTDKQVRTFSCTRVSDDKTSSQADCYSENASLDENGCASFDLQSSLGQCVIKLPIPGKHNVCNAVAAAAVAIECGATLKDIQLGLADMAPVKGRLNVHHLAKTKVSNEIRLIDDTYNANVDSIKAAVALLASYSGKRILVLGDMGELGSDAASYHQEIGEYAQNQGIDVLLTLGVLSKNTRDAFAMNNTAISEHFDNKDTLNAYLANLLENESNTDQKNKVLVKGSRSAHMENVVEDILNWHAKQQQDQILNESTLSSHKKDNA